MPHDHRHLAASPWSFVLHDPLIEQPDVVRGEQVLGLPAQGCDGLVLPLTFTGLQGLLAQRLNPREWHELNLHWRADALAHDPHADVRKAGVCLSRRLWLQPLQRHVLDTTPANWGALFRVRCEASDALSFALGQAMAITPAPAAGALPSLHWRQFAADEDWLRAWLIACIAWNPWVVCEGVRPLVSRQITVTPQETQAVAALYCHLGEQLQGWRGYVGQDLDGFDQFLRQVDRSELADLRVQVEQAAQVRAQLQRASGHAGFLDAWLGLLREHGVRVSLG